MNQIPFPHKKLKHYETVIVVQSFPILTHVMNNIEKLKKPLCVVVSFNRDVSKFIRAVSSADIDIISVGFGYLLRKSFLKPLRLSYIKAAHSRGLRISTNKLIMTCYNWCDVSAVFIDAMKFKKLTIWTPYEENRYSFKTDNEVKLSSHYHYINSITNGLIERKKFFLSNGQLIGQTIGLVSDHPKIRDAEIIGVEQIKNVIPYHVEKFNIGHDYILLVERELMRTKHISIIDYLKLLKSLRKLSLNTGLKVYVKFKPRHYYLFKHALFKAFGIKAMPVWVPAQYYCFNQECKMIIGFTSSALSINYEKPFYSLAKLKNIFKSDLSGNVNSMMHRAQSNPRHMHFLTDLSEVELLKV